jgi:hypothetical protein
MLAIIIIRILFIVLFKYSVDTRGRLRFKSIRLRSEVRQSVRRTRHAYGINLFFKNE